MKMLSKQTIVTIVVVLVIGFVAYLMTKQNQKYNTEDKANVTATISSMEEYEEFSDGSTDRGYNVYVDYEYDGKQYPLVYYTKESLSTKLKVGDTVNIEVYVRNPGTIAQKAQGFMIYMWVLFAAGVVFCVLRVKNDKKIADKKSGYVA